MVCCKPHFVVFILLYISSNSLLPYECVAVRGGYQSYNYLALPNFAFRFGNNFGPQQKSTGFGWHIKDSVSGFSKVIKGLDHNESLSGQGVSMFKSYISGIYPGTKWCGSGNISSSIDTVGTFSDTDKCCREHDLCQDFIPAGSSKYGLKNEGLFTRSHCDCDGKFYKCLKSVNSLVSSSIGYTFFTILGPQCFKQDFPAVGCEQTVGEKCAKYIFDRNAPPSYQWFDNPLY